jgi:alkylation response protein AidB-like acyl-CoA dehydrogenase
VYFALTEEQQALDESVRDYLGDRFDLEKVRQVFEHPDGDGHPAELWKQVGEAGWLAVLVPEEHDGLGLGLVDAQVIARAFGAWATPGPWRGTVLATEAIRLAGSPEQQAEWLPKLGSGEAVGAVAIEADQDAAVGTVRRVEYGAVADVVVVASGGGLALVTGATATPQEQLDLTSRVATLGLAGATVTALPGATPEVVAALADRAATLVAADLAGIARESLRRTVSYDRDRIQFGKPVGSFQAIKHDLAGLHVAVTMSEHAVLYAAHALDAGLPDAAQAVSVAKAKASETALAMTGAMIQYFGGIGFTWEHEAHFFYKRARRLAYTFGDATHHRERLASLLIGS